MFVNPVLQPKQQFRPVANVNRNFKKQQQSNNNITNCVVGPSLVTKGVISLYLTGKRTLIVDSAYFRTNHLGGHDTVRDLDNERFSGKKNVGFCFTGEGYNCGRNVGW